MKNLKLKKHVVSLLLAGSILVIPITGLAGSDHNLTWNDESKYADWFLYNKESKFLDRLWEDLNSYDFLPECIENSFYRIIFIDKEGELEDYLGNYIKSKNYYKGYTLSGYNTILSECFVRHGIVEKTRNKVSNKKLLNGLDDEELSYMYARDTLFHEIGHMLDINLCGLTGIGKPGRLASSDPLYEEIFNKEKNNYKNTREFIVDNTSVEQNISMKTEYFASSFACYLLYPEDLMEYCPETYNYIDNFVKELSNKKTKN